MKTKQLVADAMLVAMYVVLSLLSVNLGNMKFTLDSLPILVGAALFGPLDGLVIGLLGSFLNQMLTYGFTATTVLWIIPAGVRGLLVGWYAKRRGFSMTTAQTIFIVVLSAVIVTTLNTGAIYVDSKIYGYYSAAVVFGALAIRYVTGVIVAVVFSVILPPLLKVLRERVHIGAMTPKTAE